MTRVVVSCDECGEELFSGTMDAAQQFLRAPSAHQCRLKVPHHIALARARLQRALAGRR